MALSQQEKQFIENISIKATELVEALSDLEELRKVYHSRTYSGLTDVDIAEFYPDLTQAKLTAGINLINEINNKFLANLAVTQGDWQTALDQLRKLL